MKKAAPELRLPLPTSAIETLARLFDCPSTGHGFRGFRTRDGAQVWRVDWLERQRLTSIFPNGDFDFGPRASGSAARQLSHVFLCAHFDRFFPRRDERGHILKTRRIEKILRDEFTRQLVRRLPDNWQLSDEMLIAWQTRFEARRMFYFGPTICRQAFDLKFFR